MAYNLQGTFKYDTRNDDMQTATGFNWTDKDLQKLAKQAGYKGPKEFAGSFLYGTRDETGKSLDTGSFAKGRRELGGAKIAQVLKNYGLQQSWLPGQQILEKDPQSAKMLQSWSEQVGKRGFSLKPWMLMAAPFAVSAAQGALGGMMGAAGGEAAVSGMDLAADAGSLFSGNGAFSGGAFDAAGAAVGGAGAADSGGAFDYSFDGTGIEPGSGVQGPSLPGNAGGMPSIPSTGNSVVDKILGNTVNNAVTNATGGGGNQQGGNKGNQPDFIQDLIGALGGLVGSNISQRDFRRILNQVAKLNDPFNQQQRQPMIQAFTNLMTNPNSYQQTPYAQGQMNQLQEQFDADVGKYGPSGTRFINGWMKPAQDIMSKDFFQLADLTGKAGGFFMPPGGVGAAGYMPGQYGNAGGQGVSSTAPAISDFFKTIFGNNGSGGSGGGGINWGDIFKGNSSGGGYGTPPFNPGGGGGFNIGDDWTDGSGWDFDFTT